MYSNIPYGNSIYASPTHWDRKFSYNGSPAMTKPYRDHRNRIDIVINSPQKYFDRRPSPRNVERSYRAKPQSRLQDGASLSERYSYNYANPKTPHEYFVRDSEFDVEILQRQNRDRILSLRTSIRLHLLRLVHRVIGVTMSQVISEICVLNIHPHIGT